MLTKNVKVAEKFKKTKNMANLVNIACTLHYKLIMVKGIKYDPLLESMPEDEPITNLKEPGESEIYKFTSIITYLNTSNDQSTPNGKIVLTSNK